MSKSLSVSVFPGKISGVNPVKMELHDGDKASAMIGTGELVHGVISIEGDKAFLCQNIRPGNKCEDRKGYMYSWQLGDDHCDFKLLSMSAEGALNWESFVKV